MSSPIASLVLGHFGSSCADIVEKAENEVVSESSCPLVVRTWTARVKQSKCMLNNSGYLIKQYILL
jgi:hypothetical protein